MKLSGIGSVKQAAGRVRLRAPFPFGFFLALVFVCGPYPDGAAAADWPMFRGNPARTGFAAEQVYPVPAPANVWNFDVQGDVVAGPVVYGGIVYAAARTGNIYALNAYTGELIWDYSTDDWIDASPAVSGAGVYVPSRDGSLYAFDRLSGAMLWKAALGAPSVSSPLVLDGKIYVGVGAPQNKLKAFSAATGALLWQHSALLPQPVESSPSTDGGTIYFGSNDGHVYALNKDSGVSAWPVYGTQQTLGSFGANALPAGGGYVYALPGHDEKKLLRFPAADGSTSLASGSFARLEGAQAGEPSENEVTSPVLSPYGLYAGAGSRPHRLYGFDPVTLEELAFSSPSVGNTAGFGALSSPAMANEVLYVGTADARLVAVSTAGVVLWETALSSSSYSSPAVSNGYIYTGTLGGKVSAFKAFMAVSISSPRVEEVLDSTVPVDGYLLGPAVTGYMLEYGQGDSPSDWTQIVSSAAPSGISGGLLGQWNTSSLANGLYTLRLRALESAPSGTVAEARLAARVNHVPQAPAALTAADEPADSGNRVRLVWPASLSSWVASYRVYRGPYGGTLSYLAQVSTPSVTYLDASAVTGSTFTYHVTAFDGYSESAASPQASAFSVNDNPSSDAVPPSAPASLAAAPGTAGGSAALSWTAPGNDGDVGSAAGYELRYATYTSFAWGAGALWKSSRPAAGPFGTPEAETVTGLFGGVTYYFVLKAFDGNTNYSPVSAEASAYAAPDYVPPLPPSSLTVADRPGDHGGALDLAWGLSPDDGAGARDVYGYKVFRSVSSGVRLSSVPYASVGAGRSSFTDPAAPENIKFYYAVAAFDSTSDSTMTAEAFGISADNWRFFDATNGGTVRLADGAEVRIPGDGVTQNDNIMMLRRDQAYYTGPTAVVKADAGGARPTGIIYEVKFENPSTKLVKSASLYLPYTAAELGAIPEASLRVYLLDGSRWSLVNTSRVHPELKKVSAEVEHFSVYALMGYVPSGALLSSEGVYTYPNPAKGDTLTFKFLPSDTADVTIDVYNVAAEKVARLEKGGCPGGVTSEIAWRIANVASGVYVYRVEAKSASGSKAVTKKLAIIH